MILAALAVLVLLAGVLVLIPLGLRAGDRAGDLRVTAIAAHHEPPGVSVTLTNPGRAPVIIGLSLRRPSLRLRIESGGHVSLRATAATPLPGVVGVLAAGETGSFPVAAPPGVEGRSELLVVAGQEGRLRTIHREVRLPTSAAAAPGLPAAPRAPLGAALAAE